LRLDDATVSRDVFVMILDLVALHREARVGAAVVTGHVIVLEPQNIEGQPKAQILVAVERQAAGSETLCFGDVRGFFYPRWDIGTDVADGHATHRSDERHLHQIDS
jgi:hypothetical protein